MTPARPEPGPRHPGIAPTLVALALFVAGCAAVDAPPPPTNPPEFGAATAAGYLPVAAVPDSLALLPPPPPDGSPRQLADADANAKALPLRGSARWALATEDDALQFPAAAGTFACALGVPIATETTPRLYTLLQRSLVDAGRATGAAKDRYRRQRPFLVNGADVCTREPWRSRLATSGSYPSGHASAGWAWALILAEIAPERGTAILARGRDFGQSRIVCNVHWPSDVDAGTLVGAATVAALHTDPAFRRDVEAAKAEVATLRASAAKPQRDCVAEAAALASGASATR
jgi:acid phosphatase (class A)